MRNLAERIYEMIRKFKNLTLAADKPHAQAIRHEWI